MCVGEGGDVDTRQYKTGDQTWCAIKHQYFVYNSRPIARILAKEYQYGKSSKDTTVRTFRKLPPSYSVCCAVLTSGLRTSCQPF